VRRDPVLSAARARRAGPPRRPVVPPPGAEQAGHRIYLDPWAGEANEYHGPKGRPPMGPSSLP